MTGPPIFTQVIWGSSQEAMGLLVTFLTLQILRIPHLARWSILGRVLVVSNFLHMSIMRHASGKLEFYSFFQLEALMQCYTGGQQRFWFLLCGWIVCPNVNCTYQKLVSNDSDLCFTNRKTQNMLNFETDSLSDRYNDFIQWIIH